MTRKEMTEIFTVMSLAWPSAEMFKGGVERLGPTIKLWTSCLPDVDFWTAQQAVVKLCRECKFPPTIAEFKASAEAVQAEIQQAILYCSVSGQDESEVDLLVDFINGIVIVQNPHDPDALKRYIDELRRGL